MASNIIYPSEETPPERHSDDFDKWADYHATVFGLGESGHAMTLSWRNLANKIGWTIPELIEATEWIAVNHPPKFPSEHLDAVTNRIRRQRLVFVPRSDNPTIPSYPDCTDCNNTGRVIVPHIRRVRDGQWLTGDEMAVLCECKLGVWFFNRQGDGHAWITLSEYEAVNPSWAEQMKKRQEENAERHRLDIAEGRHKPDPAFQEVIQRILSRYQTERQPGEEG